MTLRRLLAARSTTLLGPALAAVVVSSALPSPARAAGNVDYGSESVSKAIGRSGSCARAATALISASQHDYYLAPTAFLKIRAVQTLASNIVTTYELPSELATFSVTEVVRCSATATRRGTRGAVPVWFSVDYAPDFSGLPLKQLKRLKRAPASSYSVNYQTAVAPPWAVTS